MQEKVFYLKPKPPFRLDLTVWVLRRRKENTIDRWNGDTYERILVLSGKPVKVRINQISPLDTPKLKVTVSGNIPDISHVVTRIFERMLGLQKDMSAFYLMALHDRNLGSLVKSFRGVKPPCFMTLFEALVNGIACQQVSLAVGIILLNRLSDAYGLHLQGDQFGSFPTPNHLAQLEPQELRNLGFSFNKARAIIELSNEFSKHPLQYENFESSDNQFVSTRLQQFKGVGRWTADYILLRGLGRLEIFPGNDVGARNSLKRWLSIDEPIDFDKVFDIMSHWYPYQGFIYFHFLLEKISRLGWI